MTVAEILKINSYLIAPYKLMGSSIEEGFDCFTLTKAIQKDLWGIELPDIHLEDDSIAEFTRQLYLIKKSSYVDNWARIDKPEHGCLVEMSQSVIPHHIGTYLDVNGGGVFHCIKGMGVCFDPIAYLRVGGWRNILFHKFVGLRGGEHVH